MSTRADTAEPRRPSGQGRPGAGGGRFEPLPAMQRIVPRTALFDVLSGAAPGTVVALSVPAGSGKTVLLRSWLASPRAPARVAWVSVERGEDDAQRFWLSVVDALAGAVQDERLVEHVSATPDVRGEAREPSVKASWAAIDASLLDALAHDRLGDRAGAERSVERALELAEPEGVILPFALFDVRELLERHPAHRTAHAALLRDILDVLSGASARSRDAPAPLRDELSAAELRVVR